MPRIARPCLHRRTRQQGSGRLRRPQKCTRALVLRPSRATAEADLAAPEQFYEQLGTMALARGVVVSVISIVGQECRLDSLGRVADVTSGTVTRVDPLTVTRDFQNILSNPIIVNDVSGLPLLRPSSAHIRSHAAAACRHVLRQRIGAGQHRHAPAGLCHRRHRGHNQVRRPSRAAATTGSSNLRGGRGRDGAAGSSCASSTSILAA